MIQDATRRSRQVLFCPHQKPCKKTDHFYVLSRLECTAASAFARCTEPGRSQCQARIRQAPKRDQRRNAYTFNRSNCMCETSSYGLPTACSMESSIIRVLNRCPVGGLFSPVSNDVDQLFRVGATIGMILERFAHRLTGGEEATSEN